MTNKSTKKALLLSVLSMLICVAMLVGTTFAWFTDSVTSGKNTITAGNLDVELEYTKTPDVEDSWKTVADATDLLDPKALWEPGHAEVVYLRVRNLGTLALKYQFSMNIFDETVGKSVLGNDIYLSDYLMYGVVDYTKELKTREEAIAAVENNAIALSGYSRTGDLEATANDVADVDTIALVVYMPTTVGNEANYRGETVPSIELGVELRATQLVSEDDFFGNDYDKNAVYADAFVDSAKDLLDAIENAENGDTIALTDDVNLNDLLDGVHFLSTTTVDPQLKIVAGKDIVIDLAGFTLSAESEGTGKNYDMIDVCGTLTVKNGSIETRHIGNNMGWGNSTNVFNVTAGGVLNLDNVSVKNFGGSDMAIGIHLNNWGEVTLNVNNSTIISTYCGVRAFNSGYDMNNVNITNSTVSGSSSSFWVHNYTVEDFGTEEKAAAQAKLLNLNFVNADDTINAAANNIFRGKIRFGFTNSKVIETENKAIDVAGSADELNSTLGANNDVIMSDDITAPATNSNSYGATALNVTNGQTIDGNGNTLSAPSATNTWDSAVNITSGTIKNLTIDSGFRGVFINHNGTAGKVYLENVIVDGPTYTISCDQGTGNGLEAVNSTFNGWTSYAATIGEVKFVNCNFGAGAGYSFSRPYAPTEYVGCHFEKGHQMDPRAAVTFENCYLDGVLITAENLATLVTSNIANASVK